MMQFIVGLIGVALGFGLVAKSEWMLENFGRVPFAEKYLGTEGGTRLFYKLLGVLIIIVALLYAFDLYQGILIWFFGPLIPRK